VNAHRLVGVAKWELVAEIYWMHSDPSKNHLTKIDIVRLADDYASHKNEKPEYQAFSLAGISD